MQITVASSHFKLKLKEVEEVFVAVVEKVIEHNKSVEIENSKLLAGHEYTVSMAKLEYLENIESCLLKERKCYGMLPKYTKSQIDSYVEHEEALWSMYGPKPEGPILKPLWDTPSASRLLVLQNVVEYSQYVTLHQEDCEFVMKYSLADGETLEDYIAKLEKSNLNLL